MDRTIIFRRWCDVILLGLVSYALVFLIASVGAVQVAFGKWAILFSSLHMGVQILLVLTGFYCARHLLLFFNVIHKRQLKNIKLSLAYPPITFSIVLCLLLFLPQFDVINFFSDSLFVSYFLGAALLFIILLSLLCAYDSLYSEKRKDKQELVPDEEWITDEEQKNHYLWLMSERPQDECDKDMLGREVYVTRIARLFKPIDSEPNRKANHIAIVGPFGIGKTSVWKSVRQQLGDDYIFVPVDGWGRGKGTVAAQIIDEMVAVLTNYVDCASIRNVPKEYMAALSGADFKGISTLAKILPLHSHQSPEELIRKIETILLSIGKTMVVVLEDFDRNPQEENIMNEVAGLLDRLRDLRSINFIVCLAPGVPTHILSRISTHREDLLSFESREFVRATLDLMMGYAGYRKKYTLPSDEQEAISFIAAINAVIKTPRDAKYALRRSYTAWKSIAGEVNIYDLLAANILRYTAPKAFDCMVENFDYIKDGFNNVEKYAEDPPKTGDVNQTLEKFLEDSSSQPIKSAVRKALKTFSEGGVDEVEARLAIKVLIPKWHSIGGVEHRVGVQRVSGRQGKVYLDRINSEQIAVDHKNLRDSVFYDSLCSGQSIIGDDFLSKLIESDYWTEKFIEWMLNGVYLGYGLEKGCEIFIAFLARRCELGVDMFCNDIDQIKSSAINRIIRKLNESTNGAVFSSFLRLMHRSPEKLFSAIETTKKNYDEDPQNVPFRNQYDFFKSNESKLREFFSQSQLLSSERKEEVMCFLSDNLKAPG